MEKESDKFEIIETIKSWYFAYGFIGCCVVLLVVITIIVSLNSPFAIIIFIIAWIVMCFFLIWFKDYAKGGIKPRRITITDKNIEILAPPKTLFKINWSEFKTLNIEKKYTTSVITDATTIRYYLNFDKKSFEILVGKDFKKKTVKAIINQLENLAKRKKKEFIGPEEKKK